MGGAQRTECKELHYSAQVLKDNCILKIKTWPSYPQVSRGDLRMTSTVGLLCREQVVWERTKQVKASLASWYTPVHPPTSLPPQPGSAIRDAVSCPLDVLTVGSVPAGHLHTSCPLLTTMLQ